MMILKSAFINDIQVSLPVRVSRESFILWNIYRRVVWSQEGLSPSVVWQKKKKKKKKKKSKFEIYNKLVRLTRFWIIYSLFLNKANHFPGGGGTRLSTGWGVPLGGWKPDPVLNRSAHEKYTVLIYILQKMFIFVLILQPRIYCPIVAYSKRNSTHILRESVSYSNTNSINMIFIFNSRSLKTF